MMIALTKRLLMLTVLLSACVSLAYGAQTKLPPSPAEVCVTGQPCGGQGAAATPAGDALGTADIAHGQQIFEGSCKACHTLGLLNAPKVGTADWSKRAEEGLASLVKNATQGIRGMPAMGGCASCRPEDIRDATAYMISTAPQ